MTTVVVTVTPGEPLAVAIDGEQVELRPKERAVAAALTLRHPDTVPVEQLIELVWTGAVPATAKQSIHNHLARVRSSAPGLVTSNSVGYALADGVRIEVMSEPAPDGESLDFHEFTGATHLRRAVADFFRQHRPSSNDAVGMLVQGHLDQVLDATDAALAADPTDERAWWLRAIATSQQSGNGAAIETLTDARAQLRDVGLSAGRRLLDLERLLRDGVDRVDALTHNPFGSRSPADDRLEEWVTVSLDVIRDAWAGDKEFRVDVRGPDGATRRHLLARVVDDARAAGFATAFARLRPEDVDVPDPICAYAENRPVVAVVAGPAEARQLELLRRSIERATSATPVGWIVAYDAEMPIVAEPADATIEVPGVDQVGGPSFIDGARTSLDELLAILAMLGRPASADHLASIVPDARAAALDAARDGLVRVDTVTQALDLRNPQLGEAVLGRLTESEHRALARALVEQAPPMADAAHAATQRSEWLLTAFGGSDERSIEATLDAAAAHSERGDFDVAAAVLKRTMRAIAREQGRTTSWCRLGVRAGQAMLAGGDPRGDGALVDVITAAWDLGDAALVSQATLERCRLGTSAGAGSVDEERLRLTQHLLHELSDADARARVGAAEAMVLSLAGEPERLRNRFDQALADAERGADPHVLADVLPLAYMSIPLHSDLDARAHHADRLLELAATLERPDVRWEGLQLRYSVEVMRGDAAFRHTLTELGDVAERVHERARTWEMHYIRSNAALIDDDLATARSEIDDSLGYSGPIHPERVTAVFGAHHLAASLAEGGAAALLDSVRALAADQPGIGAWKAALALCAAASDEREEAVTALHQLVRDGAFHLVPDPVYSAGAVAIGEAAAILADDELVGLAADLLEPLAGTWSWCGSCTFGPIDLTRARLSLAADNTVSAETAATAAVATCATMRAPRFSRQATAVLLEATR